MKIHNNYYSLQPFIFYEVAYKLSPEYVLNIVKLCQTRLSNLLTAKDFVCSQFWSIPGARQK